MWQKRDARPLQFTAEQEIAVVETAFTWRARFPLLPLVSLLVVDSYRVGEGRMDGTVLRIPVMRKHGPGIAVGAALRYLAELVWAPHAMLGNRELEWRELDAHTAEVVVRVGAARTAVRLAFDDDGDLVSSFAEARPFDGDVPRPWGGKCDEYAELGGIRIPTRAEVRWELPDGPFTYFRCTVTSAELVGTLQG